MITLTLSLFFSISSHRYFGINSRQGATLILNLERSHILHSSQPLNMLTLVLKYFKFMNYLKRPSIVGFGQTWRLHIPIGCQLIFPIRQQKQPYKCFITPAKQLQLVFLLPFLHRIWGVLHKQDRCSATRRQGGFCTALVLFSTNLRA